MVRESVFNFYKGKKVLLTGHTGFKGAWLAKWLDMLGAKVTSFALDPSGEHNLFNSLKFSENFTDIRLDIRDYEGVQNIFLQHQPEIVFHLAAQSLVRPSYKDPKYTFDVNVAGSVNILEAIKNCSSIKSVIYVTTDKCYRNKDWHWGYRENDELGGDDPYSASKAAAEVVFRSYNKSFFSHNKNLGVASVRAGNVIGGGDWSEDRLIPDGFRALESKEELEIRNPVATRPWQHVCDPLFGYMSLAYKLYESPKHFSGPWNFGPEVESCCEVKRVIESLSKNWKELKVHFAKVSDTKLKEANTLMLNCDKAKVKLGLFPTWNFDTAIEKTAAWYLEYLSGTCPDQLTKTQIKSFMEAQ